MTIFPFTRLDELPIRVDPAEIDEAIRPFALPADDARWRRSLRRRWLKALWRSAGRLTASLGRRTRSRIREEYGAAWSAGYDRYRLDRSDLKRVPWSWRGRRLLVDPAAAARLRTLFFAQVLEHLRPASVLEVGSGNGINLFALAGAFPEIAFTGVELTDEGVAQARAAQKDPSALAIFEHYTPLPVRDRSALERISFVRGDAAALPFENGAFDLVITVLAVEQMESIRERALSEIARVARRHVLMLEPFRDSNTTALRRLYVHSRDYLRGSIADLCDASLKPLWATSDYPQEIFLGTALVLAEKQTISSD